MEVTCKVCGKKVVNAVGRQKYHGRCKGAVKKYQRMGLPPDECNRLARKHIAAFEKERLQKSAKQCMEEACLAFQRTGPQSGTCMFPHCTKERWAF